MKHYSSSGLKIYTANCPKALDYLEAGTPSDNDFYQAGIAAHAVLQVVGEKQATDPKSQQTVADAVVREILEHGREYNGVREPPMSPEAAFEGRDLALAWLSWNELPENGHYEVGLGMTADGEPCSYNDERVRYRGILDLLFVDTVGDDDYAVDAQVVRDYKSAWPPGEDELHTLQRRGQTVLTHINFPEYDAIRREVVNLRTGMLFEDTIHLDDDGRAQLERWRQDILMLCDVADQDRIPRPGAGCLSCQYTLSCPACLDAYKGDGEDKAQQLAALEAVRKGLIDVLKPKCAEHPFRVNAGYVGYRKMQKRIPTKEAAQAVVEHWYAEDNDDHSMERSLIRALEPTAASIEKAAKVMYPDKQDASREDLLSTAITTKTESRFGVHKA